MKSFLVFVNLDNVTIFWIVFGIVIGVALLTTIFILLNKFVFRRHKAKNTLKEVERKYEYLHSILIGNDFQILQRIDQISRTNIIYMDIHTTYFKRFKEVRDVAAKMYGEIVKQLGSYYESNNIKGFFDLYKEKSALLKSYESTMNSLHNDLVELIKPEEEAREAILSLKDKFRELKSLYNNKEYDLFIISDSFREVFEKIEVYFKNYDTYIECASYDEAKELLPTLDSVLTYLIDNINLLPSLIKQLTNDLPQNINILKDRNKEMVMNGYPLQNINFDVQIGKIQDKVEEALNQLKKINVNKVNKIISEINILIEELNNAFNNEINSKLKFDEKIDEVLKKYNFIDKSFINISNYIVKIRKYYQIDSENLIFFNELSTKMDEVSKDKRRLDIYLHSKDPTPYSILTDKVIELENGTNEVTENYNKFMSYVESLKSDSEAIFKNIKDKYILLKEYESKLIHINNQVFIEEVNTRLNDCYFYIDEIYSKSQIIPIDVKEMKELCCKLDEGCNYIFTSIDEVLNDKERAKNNILLMNRDRCKFSEINALLNQVETLYFDGNYTKAYEMSVQVLNRLKEKSGQVNQWFILIMQVALSP